jgi:transposase
MRHVGIDMSKSDFHASFDDSGRTSVFANAPDGHREFAAALLARGFSPGDAAVGMEATGTYHLPLAAFLRRSGWGVTVINPLVVSRLAKSRLRSPKTDRIDAGTVRRALMRGEGYPFLETPEVVAVKALSSARQALVDVRSGLKRRQEGQSFRLMATDVPVDDAYAPVVAAIGREVAALDRAIAAHARDAQALLRSIPGVGPASSGAIVASVVDVRRFPSAEKLVAYLGLDCRVHESGSSVRGKGYLTKRGDRSLRHLLYMAAFVATRHVPELGAYYAKKRSEGHHHVSALCAVERKLVHLIWAVWTRGTPFVRRTETPS